MSHDPTTDAALDALLAEFTDALAAAPARTAVVKEYARRYPAQEAEFLRAALQETLLGPPPTDAPALSPEAVPVMQAGLRVLESRRPYIAQAAAAFAPAPPALAPLRGLRAEAQTRGLDAPALAACARIDVTLLAKLDQRLLRAASVPRALVDALADALHRPAADIVAFLRGPAQLALHAQYKARATPRVSAPQDFADALRAVPVLPPDDRAYWRNQISANALLGEGSGDE